MNKYFKESLMWALLVSPYVYLAAIWSELPDRVPTHFNIEGIADGWSGKSFLWFVPAGLGIFVYLLMLIIPAVDPKRKIQEMGSRYYAFRLMLTLFMSLLATYLLYVSKVGSIETPSILVILIGGLFAMFGNYFQTVRPNYFIGIRTPWTLENEQVWKKTHRLGGRLWMAGGVLIAILAVAINNHRTLMISFGVVMFLMVIIPVVFSYTEFQKEKNVLNQ